MGNGAELTTDGSSRVTAEDYHQLIGRIHELVRYTVPPAATTVVVSRGDEELLNLDGRPAWHFPRLADGRYSGEYPADSSSAIAQLEQLRADGAGYLVMPSTAFWWLDFYDDLAGHLEEHCEMVVSNGDCRIYRLLEEGSYAADRALVSVAHVPGMTRADGRMLSHFLDTLLPLGSRSAVLTAAPTHLPAGAESWQPPQAAVDEAEAAEQELAALAARGMEFLVVPKSTFEWLEAHPALQDALHRSQRLVTRQHHICEIYELASIPETALRPAPTVAETTAAPHPRPRGLLERLGLRTG